MSRLMSLLAFLRRAGAVFWGRLRKIYGHIPSWLLPRCLIGLTSNRSKPTNSTIPPVFAASLCHQSPSSDITPSHHVAAEVRYPPQRNVAPHDPTVDRANFVIQVVSEDSNICQVAEPELSSQGSSPTLQGDHCEGGSGANPSLGDATSRVYASSEVALPLSAVATAAAPTDPDVVVKPMMPSEFLSTRYGHERRCPEPTGRVSCIVTKFDTPTLPALPPGWERVVHPEGRPFFFDRNRRILTEEWIHSLEALRHLEQYICALQTRNQHQLSSDFYLVVQPGFWDSDDNLYCGYYYADPKTRCLFWAEDYDISTFLECELDGQPTSSHQRSYLEMQYWAHWQLYPVEELSSTMTSMVRNIIRDAQTDIIQAPLSTITHDRQELQDMMSVVIDAAESLCTSKKDGEPVSSWFVGRFMYTFTRTRFLNLYGEFPARLARTQSILEPVGDQRSLLITALSPLLFFSPQVHLVTMENLWVDKIAIQFRWRRFYERLIQEWDTHAVQASLLLTTNISFFAIPFVSPMNAEEVRGVSVIFSCLSTLASLGSILTSMMLSRRHRVRQDRDDFFDIVAFLHSHGCSGGGLKRLAVVYSIPYALMLWGLFCLLLAFLDMAFQHADTATRSAMAFATCLCLALALWCNHTLRDSDKNQGSVTMATQKWAGFMDWMHQVGANYSVATTTKLWSWRHPKKLDQEPGV